jgi:IclR helix-turn-helix domain
VKPSLADILAAVAELERDTSLRNAAAQIGLSPTTVRKLLDTGGAGMHFRSRIRLYEWWEWHGNTSDADALNRKRSLLEALTASLPYRARRRGMVEVLGEVERLHFEEDALPPPWIGVLRAALRAESA